MRLAPVPIPSDASKSPIIPGLSIELNDIIVLLVLVAPGVFYLSQKNHHNIFIGLLLSSPGLLASIWLIWMPIKDGQRGWQRLLARITYTYFNTKQYRTNWQEIDDYMEVKSVGKKDWRK